MLHFCPKWNKILLCYIIGRFSLSINKYEIILISCLVVASEKGVVVGSLFFEEAGDAINPLYNPVFYN